MESAFITVLHRQPVVIHKIMHQNPAALNAVSKIEKIVLMLFLCTKMRLDFDTTF